MTSKKTGIAIGIISGVVLLGAVAGMVGNSKMMKRRRFIKGAQSALNSVSGVIEKMTAV